MSHASVYLHTTDRGARLGELRLLAGDRDDRWAAPETDGRSPDAPMPDHEREAASWVRDALATDRRTRDQITALILDGTGSIFAWAEVPAGVGPRAVVQSIRRAGRSVGDGGLNESETPSPVALAPELELPEGLTIEALTDGQGELSEISRVALAAVPDLAARLLLDQLDTLGVSVERVLTLWQAMVLAWALPKQHSTPGSTAASTQIVDDQTAPTIATVLIDPPGRRLLWVWSSSSHPLACGWCRLAKDGSVPPSVFSRLGVEWIAWGSQLGRSPARVLVVQPTGALVGTTDPLPPAAWLAKQWSAATVDAIELDDPLLATIARASDRVAGDTQAPLPSSAMDELSNRPGRLDRSARWWIGLAMLAAAGGLGIAAWQLNNAGTKSDRLAQETRASWRERATAINARAFEPGVLDPLIFLDDELARQRREIAPVARRRPVMQELESIALVIGYDSIRLMELSFSQVNGIIKVQVDSTETYEELRKALNSVAGSEIGDWIVRPSTIPDGIQADFTGVWRRIGLAPDQGDI